MPITCVPVTSLTSQEWNAPTWWRATCIDTAYKPDATEVHGTRSTQILNGAETNRLVCAVNQSKILLSKAVPISRLLLSTLIRLTLECTNGLITILRDLAIE